MSAYKLWEDHSTSEFASFNTSNVTYQLNLKTLIGVFEEGKSLRSCDPLGQERDTLLYTGYFNGLTFTALIQKAYMYTCSSVTIH